MTSALVTTGSTHLSTEQILAGLHTVQSVLAPDLTADELKLFAMVANRSGLDPFAKQIYAVKRKGRVTFQTGIDGYRSIAARTGLYDGQDEPEFGPVCACGDNRPAGHPESATVRVYRKGVGRPIAATAFWHEYKPEQGERGTQDVMWTRMPRVMIAKVAEAQALRKAFPWDPNAGHGIGADLYTVEEMAQAERAETAPALPPSTGARLAQRRAAIEAPSPSTPAQEQPNASEGTPAAATLSEAGSEGLTGDELREALERAGIAIPFAQERARALFPDTRGALSGVQRTALLADLLSPVGTPPTSEDPEDAAELDSLL